MANVMAIDRNRKRGASTARPIVLNYRDTGCQFARACLTCPFSTCYHDDLETVREEFVQRLVGQSTKT